MPFTASAPPESVLPIHSRSAFAEALSEAISMSRRSTSRSVPSSGRSERMRRNSTAIASFTVDAAGKRAVAFHAAPPPVSRFSTYTAEVPEKSSTSDDTARESAMSSCEVVATSSAGGRKAEHLRDVRRGVVSERVLRLDLDRHVARREVDPQVELGAPDPLARLLLPVHPHDDAVRPGADLARDAAERDLAGRGPDDRGRIDMGGQLGG